MKEHLQPGMHPDADELSTFVEGAANAGERQQMLAHLAQCADCRKVVFLMKGAVEPEAAVSGAKREWPWRRWVIPAGLATAALACGLGTVAYVRAHREAASAAGQNAQLQKQQPGQRPENAEVTATTPTPRNEPARPNAGPNAGERTQGTVRRRGGTKQPSVDQESAADRKEMTAQAENLSLPRSAESAGATAARPRSSERPEQAELLNRSSAAPISQPVLKIEHDHGPDDGTSEVAGRVTDQTGAVVAGAKVTLRDAAGQTLQTASSADGSFDLAKVLPGRYELEVMLQGFEGYRQGVDLKPRDMAILDAPLTVGAESETVTVQAEAPQLDTSSASVAAEQVAELPSRVPAQMSVTLGKRMLSLDGEGALFVSRNRGRSWRRVKPQWAGKVTRIQTPDSGAARDLRQKAGGENAPAVFQLTTDSGAVLVSEDGTHWHEP